MSERTNIVLRVNIKKMRQELADHARRAWMGAYAADITDDGRVIQLHWGKGDMTDVCLDELITSYLRQCGIADDRPPKKRRRGDPPELELVPVD